MQRYRTFSINYMYIFGSIKIFNNMNKNFLNIVLRKLFCLMCDILTNLSCNILLNYLHYK
jgi:hypothetical protein